MKPPDGPLTSDEPFSLRMRPSDRPRDNGSPVRHVRTPTGDPAWLVTGGTEIRDLLRDSRLGRSHPEPDRMPRYVGDPIYDHAISDDHVHADQMHDRLRTLLRPHFTARRMLDLRPAIQQIVEDGLQRFLAEGPPGNLHVGFADPVVTIAICELLGVPAAERGHAMDLLERVDTITVECDEPTLGGYLRGLAACKRPAPTEDVISGLVGLGASDEETAQLCQFLLFAGIGSTVKQIDYGFLLLETNPDQRARLVADPSLTATAVEEMLRISGSLSLPRWAREDIEVAGVNIATGELVLLDYTLANLRAFTGTAMDLARTPNRHLSFSFGAWTCLGAPLARVVLQCVFATLLSRVPSMHLAVDVAEVPFTGDALAGGLTDELLVTW